MTLYKVGDKVHYSVVTTLPVGTALLDANNRVRVTADPTKNEDYVLTDKKGFPDGLLTILHMPTVSTEEKERDELLVDLWSVRCDATGAWLDRVDHADDLASGYRNVYKALADYVRTHFIQRDEIPNGIVDNDGDFWQKRDGFYQMHGEDPLSRDALRDSYGIAKEIVN